MTHEATRQEISWAEKMRENYVRLANNCAARGAPSDSFHFFQARAAACDRFLNDPMHDIRHLP